MDFTSSLERSEGNSASSATETRCSEAQSLLRDRNSLVSCDTRSLSGPPSRSCRRIDRITDSQGRLEFAVDVIDWPREALVRARSGKLRDAEIELRVRRQGPDAENGGRPAIGEHPRDGLVAADIHQGSDIERLELAREMTSIIWTHLESDPRPGVRRERLTQFSRDLA